jgi:hypothetical protein
MAYRTDVDALESRREPLRRELDEIRARLRGEPDLRARATRLENELRGVDVEQRKRSLPMLEDVRIASPCNMSWDEMKGDEKSRFCGKCEKKVYNLSAMTREEAEQFMATRTAEVCVRLYKRADGTVMTSDCPVGVRRKRVRRAAIALAGTSVLAAAAALGVRSMGTCSRAVMGEVAVSGTADHPIAVMGSAPTPHPTAPPPQEQERK